MYAYICPFLLAYVLLPADVLSCSAHATFLLLQAEVHSCLTQHGLLEQWEAAMHGSRAQS